MSGDQDLYAEGWRQVALIQDRSITVNERFWIEVIRLASWDSDPAPTLGTVQELRAIFQARHWSLPSPPLTAVRRYRGGELPDLHRKLV